MMKNLIYLYIFLFPTLIDACESLRDRKENKKFDNKLSGSSSKQDLDQLKLPKGFSIDIYAAVDNARSMVMSPSGTLFVGTRSSDKVYALKDIDNDYKADEKFVIASDLVMPNGVAFKDGDLYVASVSKLWKFDDIETSLKDPPKPSLIYNDYPTDRHHGWKYIAFGPDGKLYVPVGAPCNICESKNEMYASITRMNPDGTNREIYAHGVRNTVGFTWHPRTGEMWFTDNGRDHLGDNYPPCELNKITKKGQHFGYPYCHGRDIADPRYGELYPCEDFVKPERNLGPHVAPLGLKFYNGDMFPEEYEGKIFIAEHGSWNRSKKIGYRISMVAINDPGSASYDTFLSGWLDEDEQEAWGRPVDILILNDGSMLISDDKAGKIYRVTYKS